MDVKEILKGNIDDNILDNNKTWSSNKIEERVLKGNIDDGISNNERTWSSEKIQNEIKTNKPDLSGLKSKKIYKTLSATGWSTTSPSIYEIPIEGITLDTNWEITNSTKDPVTTKQQLIEIANAGFADGGQDVGKIRIAAYKKAPTIDINVLIIVRGD